MCKINFLHINVPYPTDIVIAANSDLISYFGFIK